MIFFVFFFQRNSNVCGKNFIFALENVNLKNNMKLRISIFVTLLTLVSLPLMAQRNKIVENPEDPAVFPGGLLNLETFLSDVARYPDGAMASGVQGTVYVRFVVEKNGNVTGAEVIEGVEEHLDATALKAVELMPQWTPARDKGKKVRSYVVMPICFTLDSYDRHITFCDIALGQDYKQFDKKLSAAGFSVQGELIHSDGQSAEMRRFDGKMADEDWTCSYAVSDKGHEVYYISGRTQRDFDIEQARSLFERLRQTYLKAHGQGFYTSLSETAGYTIQNAFGTVELSLEPVAGSRRYAVQVQVTDAKAYEKAFNESLSPKSFLSEPRRIVDGEAVIRVHTPYVFIADKLLDCKTKDAARELLRSMEYQIVSDAGNSIVAQFALGTQYNVKTTLTFVKDAVSSVVAVAHNETEEATNNDLEMSIGYQLKSQNRQGKTYVSGQKTLVWKIDNSNVQTLTFKQPTATKPTTTRRRRK